MTERMGETMNDHSFITTFTVDQTPDPLHTDTP
jgi:hypothetical protein